MEKAEEEEEEKEKAEEEEGEEEEAGEEEAEEEEEKQRHSFTPFLAMCVTRCPNPWDSIYEEHELRSSAVIPPAEAVYCGIRQKAGHTRPKHREHVVQREQAI